MWYVTVWYAQGDREETEYGPFNSSKEADDFGRDFYAYKMYQRG